MKLFIKDFFGKCELWIWSHLLKKDLMNNLIAVNQLIGFYMMKTLSLPGLTGSEVWYDF